MDSSKIEVGDVFTFDDGDTHYTCDETMEGIVHASGSWFRRVNCKLVRKADPYHGITLPEPPAGFRLAKWGEDALSAVWWGEGDGWSDYGAVHGCDYERNRVSNSIFAIPLDQPSPLVECWQFREVPWVAPGPKTLVDCVEGVDVIARDASGFWVVAYRVGRKAFQKGCSTPLQDASEVAFIRHLDPPPQKPMSLDDVPDGRVVLHDGCHEWHRGEVWFRLYHDGAIRGCDEPSTFTITNYIAELRGPA